LRALIPEHTTIAVMRENYQNQLKRSKGIKKDQIAQGHRSPSQSSDEDY
jgi:hypothetical protein